MDQVQGFSTTSTCQILLPLPELIAFVGKHRLAPAVSKVIHQASRGLA